MTASSGASRQSRSPRRFDQLTSNSQDAVRCRPDVCRSCRHVPHSADGDLSRRCPPRYTPPLVGDLSLLVPNERVPSNVYLMCPVLQ